MLYDASFRHLGFFFIPDLLFPFALVGRATPISQPLSTQAIHTIMKTISVTYLGLRTKRKLPIARGILPSKIVTTIGSCGRGSRRVTIRSSPPRHPSTSTEDIHILVIPCGLLTRTIFSSGGGGLCIRGYVGGVGRDNRRRVLAMNYTREVTNRTSRHQPSVKCYSSKIIGLLY